MVNSIKVPLPNNWKQFIDLEDIKADLARLLFCQVADGATLHSSLIARRWVGLQTL